MRNAVNSTNFRVFISHVSSHKSLAADISDAFLDDGIVGFVAHEDIEPTSEWQVVIERELHDCQALVSIFSPDFRQSRWTDQEIGIAIGRGVPVVAVRYGLDPYGFLAKYQAYSGLGKSPRVIARAVVDLLMSVEDRNSTAWRLTRALIQRLARSDSIIDAERVTARLEQVTVYNKWLADLLRETVEASPQLCETVGVSERIAKLIAKFEQPRSSNNALEATS